MTHQTTDLWQWPCCQSYFNTSYNLTSLLSSILGTTDDRFGLNTGHSTDKYTFLLKQTASYFVTPGSSVHAVFLDASKAFDSIEYYIWNYLFEKLIERKVLLQLEILSDKYAKLCTVAASNNRVHLTRSLCYCLFAPHIYMVLFLMHLPFMVNRAFSATPAESLQQHPLLFTTNRTIVHSFCKGFTWHNLHILVTAPFCCDWKARVACAQSFTLWQQATIEFTLQNHPIIACSCHIYMVLFFAHIPFKVNRLFSAMPTKRLHSVPICLVRLLKHCGPFHVNSQEGVKAPYPIFLKFYSNCHYPIRWTYAKFEWNLSRNGMIIKLLGGA